MEESPPEKSKFLLVGMVVSIEFQRSRFYIEKLHHHYPKKYEKPDIRPLLNVDWHLYLNKIRRRFGGRIWALQKNCVAFLDNVYIGDDDAVFKYLQKYVRLRTAFDFSTLGIQQLKSLLDKSISDGNRFAYFSFSLDGISIGAMLFLLYAELVPLTSKIFLKRCESRNNGWLNKKVHRIVRNCWIQVGGFNLKSKRLPCENYVIPHDRRGVLSMCNACKHTDNNSQFVVSLNPTPWMDYKYVAFGQLIQGEETLRKIEAVQTRYEDPKQEILITLCGEYKLEVDIDSKHIEEVMKYYQSMNAEVIDAEDVIHPDDVDSVLSVKRYRRGDYCLESDIKSNLEAMHLPEYLVKLYQEYTGTLAVDEEAASDDVLDPDQDLIPITDMPFYTSNLQTLQRLMKESQEVEYVDHDLRIESEIIQKVTIFDTEAPPPRPQTSSLVIEEEERKRMYL